MNSIKFADQIAKFGSHCLAYDAKQCELEFNVTVRLRANSTVYVSHLPELLARVHFVVAGKIASCAISDKDCADIGKILEELRSNVDQLWKYILEYSQKSATNYTNVWAMGQRFADTATKLSQYDLDVFAV
jgi:hypothetical protein